MEIQLIKVKCAKCGYEWIPRVKRPVKCPNQKCQAFDWDVYEKKAEVETE